MAKSNNTTFISDKLLFGRQFELSVIATIHSSLPFYQLTGKYPKLQVSSYLSFAVVMDDATEKLTRSDENKYGKTRKTVSNIFLSNFDLPDFIETIDYFHEILTNPDDHYVESKRIVEPYNVPKVIPKKEFRSQIEVATHSGSFLLMAPTCLFSQVNEVFEPALAIQLYDAKSGEMSKAVLDLREVRAIKYLLRNFDLSNASRTLVSNYSLSRLFIRNRKFDNDLEEV